MAYALTALVISNTSQHTFQKEGYIDNSIIIDAIVNLLHDITR